MVDPKLQVPLTHEFNVGIQREIGWNSAFELRYVGSRSNQLVRSIDYNQVNIRDNGFLADFIRARSNCLLQGAVVNPTSPTPLLACTNAGFNPLIPGSQPLTVFPNLGGGGFLTDSTVLGQIQAGTPGQLGAIYIQNGLTGTVKFLANPSTGVANVLGNGGMYNYNALQAEIRRRLSGGLSFAVNYSFQKILADTTQETQFNVDPLLDIANPRKSYARPDFDRTHTVNANMNLDLPFGRGRRWMNDGGVAGKVFGDFQFTSIINVSSGPPVSIRDPRGTLNRDARSLIQPASSTLSTNEIKKLIGVFRTPNGVFYVDPSVLQATVSGAGCGGATTFDLNQRAAGGMCYHRYPWRRPVGRRSLLGSGVLPQRAGFNRNAAD